jgi:hypothetical protein
VFIIEWNSEPIFRLCSGAVNLESTIDYLDLFKRNMDHLSGFYNPRSGAVSEFFESHRSFIEFIDKIRITHERFSEILRIFFLDETDIEIRRLTIWKYDSDTIMCKT